MRAIATLRSALAPLGIEPVLTVKELDETTFHAAPGESNRIWIDGKALEEWLGAQSGSSQCCAVCGEAECRTTEIAGTVYEEVPERLIVQAGLMAASRIVGDARSASSCCQADDCCSG